MLQLEAPVVKRQGLAGDYTWVSLHAPQIATRAQPGQLLAVRVGLSPWAPLLRQPFALAGADSTNGTVSLLLSHGSATLVQHPGATVDVLGPVGRGWSLDARTRNVLLLGTERHVGALLFLAHAASQRACNVALLVGASEGQPARPAPVVPATVEYQFARGADATSAALDLLDNTLLSWADALYTTFPVDAYPALAERIRSGRIRWGPGFAQGLLVPPMACFVGICDTCLVTEARRPWRACVDGPQCDVRDFVR